MKKDITFEELFQMSRAIINGFEKVENKTWNIEAMLIELMKQVGDLSRRVLMFEKYYPSNREKFAHYRTTKNHIADELADIMLNIIRIADYYGIDLKRAQVTARKNELKYLAKLNKLDIKL